VVTEAADPECNQEDNHSASHGIMRLRDNRVHNGTLTKASPSACAEVEDEATARHCFLFIYLFLFIRISRHEQGLVRGGFKGVPRCWYCIIKKINAGVDCKSLVVSGIR